MLSEVRLKNLEFTERSMILVLIITVQIFFLCQNIFPVLQQNSLFSLSGKSKTKLPVFPVPWPPWERMPVGRITNTSWPYLSISNGGIGWGGCPSMLTPFQRADPQMADPLQGVDRPKGRHPQSADPPSEGRPPVNTMTHVKTSPSPILHMRSVTIK